MDQGIAVGIRLLKYPCVNSNVKGIKFRRNYGKSAALNRGFELAQGSVVITMDADLQDVPDEIPALYRMIIDDNFDLVSGWKQNRQDPKPRQYLQNYLIGLPED